MKRIFTLTVATLITVATVAQQPYKVYCALSARHSETSTTAISRVEIDYGQERLVRNYLVDESGKPLKLNSITAVANYMSKLGWELEDSYVVGEDIDHCVWIMSKYVNSDEEITDGFTTRWMLENNGSRSVK